MRNYQLSTSVTTSPKASMQDFIIQFLEPMRHYQRVLALRGKYALLEPFAKESVLVFTWVLH